MGRVYFIAFILIFYLVCFSGSKGSAMDFQADSRKRNYMGVSKILTRLTPELMSCFYSASAYYGVSPELLMAIAYTESGFNARAVNVNTNRSIDMGIMQINSSWLPYLSRYGVRKEHIWDPCYNIHLGAMVLRHCIDIHGYNWKAVDCYNKGPKKARENGKYIWKVYQSLEKLRNKIQITQVNNFNLTESGS